MIPVLILAAGASSRMGGRDKLMEDVGGVPLLRRQIDIAAGVGAVYVALPAADHPRMAALVGTRASPLIAQNAADGMGATLRDAVAQLPVCGAFMVLLGDLISLENSELLDVLHLHRTEPDRITWRGATPAGKPGHPIIFHASLRPQFGTLNGDRGADVIARAYVDQSSLCRFADDRALHDLDTPADWAGWHASQT